MTSEEIKAAIERLGTYCNSTYDVMLAFMNYDHNNNTDYGCTKFKGVLVDLLKQADPDTHIKLPLDADGVPIHVGDELISKHSKKTFVVTRLKYSRKHAWMVGGADKDDLSEYGLYAPCETRHYHKPTVEDVLTEYADKWNNVYTPEEEAALVLEYADRLREVMADDDEAR